ncbi:class I SAM-dependent methyltransferase [Candidatus Peregrinibacteria bacterium]|nr:class I SAM-dependent methyltransferase [Candidatus Peregrinibacteria bacterium]MBI3815997.1 class I SAM-dependent methyltransferase [Candidatus Peregrinibacteria bacterium]
MSRELWDDEPPRPVLMDVDAVWQSFKESNNQLSFRAISGMARHFWEMLMTVTNLSDPAAIGSFIEKHQLGMAVDEFKGTYNIPRTKIQGCGKHLLRGSVHDFTKYAIRQNLTPAEYVCSFLVAAVIQCCIHQISGYLHDILDGTHHVCTLALPGKEMTHIHGMQVPANLLWVLQNMWMDYVVLLGGVLRKEYDDVQRRGIYRHAEASEETPLARNVISQRSAWDGEPLVAGNVLELGPGGGADVEYYLKHGAHSVEVIDSSPSVLGKLLQRKAQLDPDVQKCIFIRDAENMHEGLRYVGREGRKFRLITSNSSSHYWDKSAQEELFNLIHDCLEPGGYLALGVKAPEGLLGDRKSGILLYEDTRKIAEITPSGRARVHRKQWQDKTYGLVKDRLMLNHDGIVRGSHGLLEWLKILGPWFDREGIWKTEGVVQGFEMPGVGQHFYIIIAPRRSDPLLKIGEGTVETEEELPDGERPLASKEDVPSGNQPMDESPIVDDSIPQDTTVGLVPLSSSSHE